MNDALRAMIDLVREECPGVVVETAADAIRFGWVPPLAYQPGETIPESVEVRTRVVTPQELIDVDDLLDLARQVAAELREESK